MQNRESFQLSLFDFNFKEDEQVNGGNELLLKNEVNHFEDAHEKFDENLLAEVLQLNTSNIFELKENGRNSLEIDEFKNTGHS
ncbi:hypothetical protein J2S74_001508 [Evansella vedderi]|uniref:Uncharacterized protein n=1 Tax=Evansella vedderi TaxID=38282 RepID=A0ABT9ZT71_9BACI|nr:hypothetical protein [Evansella vedderi]MDQ0254135.1 hypothetical protein [Evansella vedderi]